MAVPGEPSKGAARVMNDISLAPSREFRNF